VELYLCRHLGWEFTALVYHSRKAGVWLVVAPSETYYLGTREDVERVLKGFEECKLVEKGKYIPKSKVEVRHVGLK